MSFKEQILSKTSFPEGTLCLAFSGGSDSLALLSLLPKERSYAVYIDHNIRDRKELDKEIKLNRRNAERFSIPLKVLTIERGDVISLSRRERIGLEAAARKLRYSLLLKENADYILTAHHMDDQAETVLMRLLSGSPIYRLEGIKRENGRICRPFLSVEKELINSYIKEEGLEYSSDSTNTDTSYKRNFIRLNILPHLTLDDKRRLLSISLNIQQLNKRGSAVEVMKGFCYSFERESYLMAPIHRREEALYRINKDLGFSALLSRREIVDIEHAVREGRGYNGARFFMRYNSGMIRFFPRHMNVILPADRSFLWEGLSYSLSDNAFDDKTLIIDFSLIKGPLVFRESREGDIIELKEGRKKLIDLAKEYKVPYFFILEDTVSIVAVFSRLFGAKDRICRRFLGRDGKACSLTEVKTRLN